MRRGPSQNRILCQNRRGCSSPPAISGRDPSCPLAGVHPRRSKLPGMCSCRRPAQRRAVRRHEPSFVALPSGPGRAAALALWSCVASRAARLCSLGHRQAARPPTVVRPVASAGRAARSTATTTTRHRSAEARYARCPISGPHPSGWRALCARGLTPAHNGSPSPSLRPERARRRPPPTSTPRPLRGGPVSDPPVLDLTAVLSPSAPSPPPFPRPSPLSVSLPGPSPRPWPSPWPLPSPLPAPSAGPFHGPSPFP